MGELSNQLLVVTILAYLAAMLCHAVQYAFGTRGAVARGAAVNPALVGSANPALVGSAIASDSPAVPDNVPTGSDGAAAAPDAAAVAPDRAAVAPDGVSGGGPAALAGAGAVGFTLIGVAVHLATLVTRGLAAHRVPWGNMYEFVLAVCLVGAVAWLVTLFARPALRHLGLFVTMLLIVLLGVAGMNLYTKAGPLVPALNSYWLKIHVSAAATASGLLLFGFVVATLTLIRTGYDSGRVGFPFSLGERLPAAATLERLTFRMHALAFPIWTFAIICGAIWAEAAWGRYWGWDPKETWSFISWVVYAGYLHARATPSVKRSTATWIAVAGWVTMMINLYGVNLVVSGLHSYAGVS
jgi:cytochrome c-type biogenesis protein CcsB